MTPETALLLATLRGVARAAPASIDWHALLDLAESHGVLPLFCRQYPGPLPETLMSRVRGQWTTSAFMASALEDLLEQFSLHGLEVLPLKGPLLAQVLYGSPGSRPCDDLDLLVQPQDFCRAQSLLPRLGFEPIYPADDYHQCFQRSGTVVELHFSLAPPSSPAMDLQGAWERAPVMQFRRQRSRFLGKPDLLIYLVIHGVKHEFARLIWVLDVVRALADMDESNIEQVFTMARTIGVEGALLTACELARFGFNIELPAQVTEALVGKPVVSSRAAVMWQEILAGPANPQTLNQGAGVFVQLETDLRHRWVQRLRYFRPSQQDRLWAQHHRIHPRWMVILRPLRLLSKHGPASVWRTLFPRVAA